MSTIYERMQALCHLSNWISGERRAEDRRQMYVRRRRAWLWRPLALLGAALITLQITSWEPSTALLIVGFLMCLPWVGDC